MTKTMQAQYQGNKPVINPGNLVPLTVWLTHDPLLAKSSLQRLCFELHLNHNARLSVRLRHHDTGRVLSVNLPHCYRWALAAITSSVLIRAPER